MPARPASSLTSRSSEALSSRISLSRPLAGSLQRPSDQVFAANLDAGQPESDHLTPIVPYYSSLQNLQTIQRAGPCPVSRHCLLPLLAVRIKPCRPPAVNSARGNKPYGECDRGSDASCLVPANREAGSDTATNRDIWTPPGEVRLSSSYTTRPPTPDGPCEADAADVPASTDSPSLFSSHCRPKFGVNYDILCSKDPGAETDARSRATWEEYTRVLATG
jgi:hypothetical protein